MRSNVGRVVVCAVGLKGLTFLKALGRQRTRVDVIAAYNQPDDAAQSFQELVDCAAALSVPLIESRQPEFQDGDLAFLVGWQYLIRTAKGTQVVFHVSLLTLYRGFATKVMVLK